MDVGGELHAQFFTNGEKAPCTCWTGHCMVWAPQQIYIFWIRSLLALQNLGFILIAPYYMYLQSSRDYLNVSFQDFKVVNWGFCSSGISHSIPGYLLPKISTLCSDLKTSGTKHTVMEDNIPEEWRLQKISILVLQHWNICNFSPNCTEYCTPHA